MLPGGTPQEIKLDAIGDRFLLLFAASVALGTFTAARFYMVTWIGERVTTDLRQAVYAHVLTQRVRKLSRASQDRIADASGTAGVVLNAIPVVQSFVQERAETARFSSSNEQAFLAAVRRTRTRALLTAFLIVGVFAFLLYSLYGGVQAVVAGRMTAGTLSQTALYIALIASSVAVQRAARNHLPQP